MHESPNRATAIANDSCRPGIRANLRNEQCRANTMPSVRHMQDSSIVGPPLFHKRSDLYRQETDPLKKYQEASRLNRGSLFLIIVLYLLHHLVLNLFAPFFEERNNQFHFLAIPYSPLREEMVWLEQQTPNAVHMLRPG